MLDEYGTITTGISHHFRIYFNDSSITVTIFRDESIWTKSWARSPTLESHLGDAVPVWFTSNKFGPSVYNRANVNPSTNPSISPTVKPITNGANPTDPIINPTAKPSISPTVDNIVNSSQQYNQNASSLSGIPGIYFLIAGAIAFSLCFICLGLMAFLWVRCKSMHSQIHDIRGHIHTMQKKQSSDFESFYSPVAVHGNEVNGQNIQRIAPGHIG